MGEEYLQARKTALLAKVDETTPNIEDAIEQLAEVNLALGSSGSGGSVDVSTLAKETTLTTINGKLPSLSSGNIPVDINTGSTVPDIRTISTPGSYTFNNYYSLYITVLNGDNGSVILKKTGETSGAILSTNRIINFESIAGKKHGSITLSIASGGIVEIIGEN